MQTNAAVPLGGSEEKGKREAAPTVNRSGKNILQQNHHEERTNVPLGSGRPGPQKGKKDAKGEWWGKEILGEDQGVA